MMLILFNLENCCDARELPNFFFVFKNVFVVNFMVCCFLGSGFLKLNLPQRETHGLFETVGRRHLLVRFFFMKKSLKKKSCELLICWNTLPTSTEFCYKISIF